MKVKDEGSLTPRLFICGEAPGRDESTAGRPFVGASGHLLNQILESVGLSRHEVYLTNVVDERPPNNNFGIYYSDNARNIPTELLLSSWERVRSKAREIAPGGVVLCLGEEAMRAFTGLRGISNRRGIFENRPHYRVLPTFHPAYLLRGAYQHKPIVELDFKKALRNERFPLTNFNISPSFQEVLAFLRPPWPRKVAFDIETTYGREMTTRTFGFAWSPTEGFVIPFFRNGAHYWEPWEEEKIHNALAEWFASDQTKWVLQNAPFDLTVIAREFGHHISNVHLDTMFAHHTLYPELPKSLDFLSSVYTTFPLYWDKKSGDLDNARYNAYDCCATWISSEAIEKELRERGMWEFYRDEIHPASFALTRMQNRGILIDEEGREDVKIKTQAELDNILAALEPHNINPFSPKQVAEFLYDRLKLPRQVDRKTKRPTTRDDALQQLARKNPIHAPVIDLILNARKRRVLLSTFIEAETGPGGRMYTTYNLAGQVTGRISSSKTIEGYGANLTNIPRGSFRRLYRADPGYLIIKSDLRQAEYMCFCWFAKVWEYIDQYTNNPDFDVHRLNASLVYGVPESQVTKDQRSNTKNSVYAGNYRVGALKISKLFNIEFSDAKRILDRYRTVRPELERWWHEIETQIRTTRKLRNPLGRERVFFGRIDDDLFRSAFSHACQSTVADIILSAIVDLDAQGIELLLQVHDEIVCQCPVDQLHSTVAKVKAAMERPITVPGVPTPLVIPTEIAVGPNWYDLTDYDEYKRTSERSTSPSSSSPPQTLPNCPDHSERQQ